MLLEMLVMGEKKKEILFEGAQNGVGSSSTANLNTDVCGNYTAQPAYCTDSYCGNRDLSLFYRVVLSDVCLSFIIERCVFYIVTFDHNSTLNCHSGE